MSTIQQLDCNEIDGSVEPAVLAKFIIGQLQGSILRMVQKEIVDSAYKHIDQLAEAEAQRATSSEKSISQTFDSAVYRTTVAKYLKGSYFMGEMLVEWLNITHPIASRNLNIGEAPQPEQSVKILKAYADEAATQIVKTFTDNQTGVAMYYQLPAIIQYANIAAANIEKMRVAQFRQSFIDNRRARPFLRLIK